MCKQFLTFSRDVVILQSVGLDELNNLRYPNLYIPWSLLPKFDNHVCVSACVCLCGLGCMLVEKKNAQGKFNTIKSRTIPPKYQKILSSPSSTFFTMTASLESFSRLVFRVRQSHELDRGWLLHLYGTFMACLYVYVYLDLHVHMKVLNRAKFSARLHLHFSIFLNMTMSLKSCLNILQLSFSVWVWCGLCCMLVEKKMHKVNLTP